MTAQNASEPAPLTARLELCGDPVSVARARQFVTAALTAWQIEGDAVDVAVLLVSELVTNAATHGCARSAAPIYDALAGGGSDIVVRLTYRAASLFIEVFDPSLDPPRRLEARPEDESGRGVQLLDELSVRWSHRGLAFGKVVWCEVAVSGRRATSSSSARAAAPSLGGPSRGHAAGNPIVITRLSRRTGLSLSPDPTDKESRRVQSSSR